MCRKRARRADSPAPVRAEIRTDPAFESPTTLVLDNGETIGFVLAWIAGIAILTYSTNVSTLVVGSWQTPCSHT